MSNILLPFSYRFTYYAEAQFLFDLKCQTRNSCSVLAKSNNRVFRKLKSVAIEVSLNLFTEVSEFSDKNICHYMSLQ